MQKIENRWGHKSLILPSSDFFGDENSLKKQQSQATWSKELFGYLKKICYIWRKKVLKLPRILKDLGRFQAFFFRNCHN